MCRPVSSLLTYVCTERGVFHMPQIFVNSFVRRFSHGQEVKLAVAAFGSAPLFTFELDARTMRMRRTWCLRVPGAGVRTVLLLWQWLSRWPGLKSTWVHDRMVCNPVGKLTPSGGASFAACMFPASANDWATCCHC